jgi:S-(hydroxymethyl)glutathione dehydrogenase/alcohol dehydrogenase
MDRQNTSAAVLVEIGQPLQIWDLAIPALKPGQVLVDVAFSGVCHTQLLEIEGKRGHDRFIPHTLGHEGSGVVVETGPGVSKVKSGDHVVLTWIKGEGADVGSTSYQHSTQIVNSGAISTFMRRTIISENRLVPIPQTMPLREAALLGCAFPTGAGIVFKSAGVKPGDSVAIFGAGGIGLSAVAAASLMNADPIVAVDIHDYKLQLAASLGARHTINSAQGDAVATLLALTGGRGFDVVIEAVGRKETMEAAFQATRDHGGVCVLAGNLPHGETISVNPFHLIRGRRMVGTWGGETQPDRDIALYARLHESGKLKLAALATGDYSLDDINQAFADLKRGAVGRALIDMERVP